MDIYQKVSLYTLLGLNPDALKKALEYIGDKDHRFVLFTTEYSALSRSDDNPLDKVDQVIEKMRKYIDMFE